MPEKNSKRLVLDAASVKEFAGGPMADLFQDTTDNRKDSGPAPAARTFALGYTTPNTIGLAKPLALGFMASNDEVHGSSLNTAVLQALQGIDKLFQSDEDFARQTIEALTDMAKQLTEHQGKHLQDINAQDFLGHYTGNSTSSSTSSSNSTTSTSTSTNV